MLKRKKERKCFQTLQTQEKVKEKVYSKRMKVGNVVYSGRRKSSVYCCATMDLYSLQDSFIKGIFNIFYKREKIVLNSMTPNDIGCFHCVSGVLTSVSAHRPTDTNEMPHYLPGKLQGRNHR